MKVLIEHTCAEADSYRAARVKSLFNCESGARFSLDADLPIEDGGWHIGVIVGPSGSGKSSLGHALWGARALWNPRWPKGAPIIDAIGGDFDAATAALAAVGLGSVPTWLRPFHALSNGEQFRANMARLVADAPQRAVVDEFTSVIDRQIARIGAIGYHPSLLPRHRGRDAIRWAIHMRDQVAGGSVYWITDRADAGPVAAQDWCHIRPGDDAAELWRRELAPMGLRLVERVVRDVAAGRIVAEPQDEAIATWEPSFDRPALGAGRG